jgi:hypothetical protein
MRVPQPLNSPDLAPCDFFLFGNLKSQSEGKTFFDENNLKTEVERILRKIPITLLCFVMEDWIHRLNQCIESAGDYVS